MTTSTDSPPLRTDDGALSPMFGFLDAGPADLGAQALFVELEDLLDPHLSAEEEHVLPVMQRAAHHGWSADYRSELATWWSPTASG